MILLYLSFHFASLKSRQLLGCPTDPLKIGIHKTFLIQYRVSIDSRSSGSKIIMKLLESNLGKVNRKRRVQRGVELCTLNIILYPHAYRELVLVHHAPRNIVLATIVQSQLPPLVLTRYNNREKYGTCSYCTFLYSQLSNQTTY